MLNIERIDLENLLQDASPRDPMCYIATKKAGIKCQERGCGECRAEVVQWLAKECREPILNESEKIILRDIIKAFEPFGKKLLYISKKEYFSTEGECFLEFHYESDKASILNFKSDELFRGMESGRDYNLEELELNDA